MIILSFIIFNLESLIFSIVSKMQMCSKHVHVNIYTCIQVKDRKCECMIIDSRGCCKYCAVYILIPKLLYSLSTSRDKGARAYIAFALVVIVY